MPHQYVAFEPFLVGGKATCYVVVWHDYSASQGVRLVFENVRLPPTARRPVIAAPSQTSAQPSNLTALKIVTPWQLLRLDCDHYIVPSYGNFLRAHSQRHLQSSSAFEEISPLQGATLHDKSKKASNTFSSSRRRGWTPPCWRDIIRALEAPWTRERESG